MNNNLKARLPIYLYFILFPLTYLIIVYNYNLATYPVLSIILLSYYRLICLKEHETIIFLSLFSRCLCGFVAPNNYFIWNIVNILTNYLPVALFCIINFRSIKREQIKIFPFTLSYFVLMILYSIISFLTFSSYDDMHYMIRIRLLPVFFSFKHKFFLCKFKLS